MEAVYLYNQSKKHDEVIKYKNIYYTSSGVRACQYKCFVRTHKKIKDIKVGSEYYHAYIDGKLYSVIFTNELDAIARDSIKRMTFSKMRLRRVYKQLSIFDDM